MATKSLAPSGFDAKMLHCHLCWQPRYPRYPSAEKKLMPLNPYIEDPLLRRQAQPPHLPKRALSQQVLSHPCTAAVLLAEG